MESLLSHSRVGPLTVDNRVQIGRRPNLRDDANGPVVPNFIGGNRMRRSHSLHLDAFHGLRAELLRVDLALVIIRDESFLDRDPHRWRADCRYGGSHSHHEFSRADAYWHGST